MNRPRRTAIFTGAAALAFALLAPGAAIAWSAPGHEIVAAIAEPRLTPAARELLRELVGDTPLSAREIAAWADTLRDREKKRWHFVNIPFSAERYDSRRDCPRGACAVVALERAVAELSGRASPMRRADALRWLVHLVGDLHQPLHAGDAWDRGGNDLRVRIGRRRQPSNLHRIWDDDLVKPLLRRETPLSASRALAAEISRADAERWAAELRPVAWAEESHREARAIYAELGRRPQDETIAELPRDYAAAQRSRVESALGRAGVRLAALLNRIASGR